MRILKNILLFQKRIFFKAYILSVIAGSLFGGKPILVAVYLFFVAPFIHYSVYDLMDKQKYYYYYNLGLSKVVLWASTMVICVVNFFVIALI